MAAPSSPVKSLSVREDASGSRALHTKTGKNKYACIANFYFSIEAFVKFSQHSKYNGYILNVCRTDGESMECFATCEEIEFAKKFKAAINRTFTEKGGVLWQGITDRQLTAYVMQIVKEFSTSPEKKTLWGSLVIGRQPNMRKVDTDGEFVEENDRGDYEEKNDFDSAVYILNENVQMNKDGVIERVDWTYRWMVPFLKSMPVAAADKKVKNYLDGYPIHIRVPVESFDWHFFMGKAKLFFNINFMPFTMFLSGAIAAFHYAKILSLIGSCPVSTAIGDTASGKSTALRIISQMMGMHLVSQSSAEFVGSDLANTTIPLCWDDPTHPSVLHQPLVSAFNGIGNQTKGRGNERPLTSFLLTINFEMDDDMRSFERTTPIWFDKVINMELHDSWGFMDARREMFSIASTNCLPHVIRLSEPLNEENFSSNIAYFTEHLTQLPSRLSEIYSVYRLLANEIVKLVNDEDIISSGDVDAYLQTKFLPYVVSLYVGTVKAHTSFGDFLKLLVEAISKLQLTPEKMSSWLRPLVKGKKEKLNYVVFILPKALDAIEKAGLSRPSESNVRDLVKSMENSTTKHKSFFVGLPKKVSCLKIARKRLSEDMLQEIDKLFAVCPEAITDSDENDACNDPVNELTECGRCQVWEDEKRVWENEKRYWENEKREIEERQVIRRKLEKEEHDKETEALVKMHRAKHAKLEEENNELRRQVEFLQGVIRERKKETKKTTASESSASKVESATKPKAGGTSSGCSVTMSVSRIVESQVSSIPDRDLNDSGMGEDLSAHNEEIQTNSTSRKRGSQVKPEQKNRCNLCTKKKTSSTIMCVVCKQWQHCSCVGLKFSEATAMQDSFTCQDCK